MAEVKVPQGAAFVDTSASKGPVPVKFDAETYRDLDLVARVTKQPISKVARDLLRAPLAHQLGKLAAEIAELKRQDKAYDQLAEKARKKVSD